MSTHGQFLAEAVALATSSIAAVGSPYGGVIVCHGDVVRAAKTVHATDDPRTHAEMVAIREARRLLGGPDRFNRCIREIYARAPAPNVSRRDALRGFKQGDLA